MVEVKVRPQLFSIRRPLSYQVADALLLPQPSSLVGALASCLAKLDFKAAGMGDEHIKSLIDETLRGLERVAVKPTSPIVASPVVLSRLRVLEKTSDEIEQGGRLSDAMVREYVHGSFTLYFVFRNHDLALKAEKALFLLERIGDTESLVAVESINLCRLSKIGEKADVDTSTRADWVNGIEGDFVAARMCVEGFAREVVRVGRGKLSTASRYLDELREKYECMFYLPLKIERVKDRVFFVPTNLRLEVKPGFKIVEAEAEDRARLVVSLPHE